MKINNKAIAPVIAITLLIVVAVTSVIGFQTWFSSFSSSLESKAEFKLLNEGYVKILHIDQNNSTINIYIQNSFPEYLVLNEIKILNTSCTLSNQIIQENSITKLELTNCNLTSNLENNIVLYLDEGIYEEKKFIP